jgi:hypothetical protein
MFFELAKSWRLLAPAALLPFVIGFLALNAFRFSEWRFNISGKNGVSGSVDAIEEMRRALAQERAQLAALERDQSSLRLEVIHRRNLYQNGQVSKEQVHEAEQAFIAALTQMHAARDAVNEMDIGITEAVLGEKVNRIPVLPVNGYSETKDLKRFNGSFRWSLREAPRIESYFSRIFGRRLPVTAMGQSPTHNRLRFDHHDSMDVAVHPDSVEGKALIAHLRKNDIPFIAFRGASPGVSTGPHIHIGRPSARLRH